MQAPGQVQRGSREGSEGSGEGREALVQSQVRFNRVPEKVPEKVWEALEIAVGSFQRLASQNASERSVKIRHCGCWGYH